MIMTLTIHKIVITW